MGRSAGRCRSIGVLLAALWLAACGGPAATPASQATRTVGTATGVTPATPPRGGTIVYALGPADINWYFPLQPVAYGSSVDRLAAEMMYKPLFYVGSDGKVDFSRSIASSIAWNSNGTVYTVDLNPKWHWSDGTSVTAGDVLFTWQLIQAASAKAATSPWPYAGAGSGGVPGDIKAVTAVSPTEVTFTLTHPVNQQWFEYDGLSQFTPLPAKAWNKYPGDPVQELAYITRNATNIAFYTVVDGPFKMVSGVDKQAWTFVPNPSYDGHRAFVDTLVLAYQTSGTAEVGGLRTGAIQVGSVAASEYTLRDQLTSDNFSQITYYGYCSLILNFGNPTVGPILDKLPVRQAMAMAIDQQGLIAKLYNGHATVGTGPVPLIPPTFLDPKLEQPPYAFNTAAGKALLERSGWTERDGVMTNAQGQKLQFDLQFVGGVSDVLAMVQVIQSDWAKEGIKVNLQPMPFATMVGLHLKANAGKWQIQAGICSSLGASVPTGEKYFRTGGPANFYQFSDPSLDKLIDATIAPEPTAAAQQAAMYAYDDAVARDLPQIWLPKPYGFRVVAKSVHGVTSTENDFTGAISPQYWWISR